MITTRFHSVGQWKWRIDIPTERLITCDDAAISEEVLHLNCDEPGQAGVAGIVARSHVGMDEHQVRRQQVVGGWQDFLERAYHQIGTAGHAGRMRLRIPLDHDDPPPWQPRPQVIEAPPVAQAHFQDRTSTSLDQCNGGFEDRTLCDKPADEAVEPGQGVTSRW
jgi:hypothetical protein